MKSSWKFGLFTLLLFGGGGILIIEFLQNQSTRDVLTGGQPPFAQITTGLIAGVISSALAIGIISRPFFQPTLHFYENLIAGWNLRLTDIIFLSLCAGFAEELFFRVGLQPLLGIWWTAVLFVFLHGYLNPYNWRISIYGTILTGIIAGFGYLYLWYGIYTPMIAHAVLDIALFRYLTRKSTIHP